MNVFLQIDKTLLSADRQARMKDKMVEHDRMVAVNSKPKPAVVPQLVSNEPPPYPAPLKQVDYPNAPPPFPTPNQSTPGIARVGDPVAPTPPPAPAAAPKAPTTAAADTPTQTMPPMGAGTSNPGVLANQVQALQEVEFQRLRAEGLKVQREAQSRF